MSEIKGFLCKDKAEEIFNAESIYLSNGNIIPCYRIAELFGEWTEEFAREKLKDGNDCNAWGDCHERPMIYYLHKSGFMKVVAERNYRLMKEEITEKGISGDIYEPIKRKAARNERNIKET